MQIVVKFPEGLRQVPALVMGKWPVSRHHAGAMLVVPRCVPGHALRREKRGWVASPTL
jgi:hypothetical protein